jgi:hypothetical protein
MELTAAMVNTKTTGRERSGGYDLTRNVVVEADRAVTARANDLKRCKKNWEMYFAADGGQWDEEDKIVLRKDNRHIAQFDVVSPKIDALAGALLADLPDMSWTPAQGEVSIVTEAIAESYYADKEMHDYDDKILKVFRDGLVHCGDAFLCMDSRYGYPTIRIDRELPGYIVWDPYWKTDNDRDAECVYRFRYLTAAGLMAEYESKAEEVLRVIRDKKGKPVEYETGADRQRRQLQTRVGDEYKVIEKHYIERVRGKRLLGRREGSQQWIPFPIGKDEYYLSAFAEANQIDWTTVVETKYEDRIHYCTTVCEELNVLLKAEEKSDVQVNGLPFYHFSVKRYDGKDMGIAEGLIDVQQTINKRESLVTELISKANGGSTFVDQTLFLDEKQRQEWIKNKNKPGHAEFVDLSASHNPVLHLSPNNYPPTVLDQIARMYDKVLPLVSRASDALSSITDSGDSGILFERKFQLNLIANTLLNRGVRQFMNNIGEGYFYQWQLSNQEIMREVTFRDGRSVVLNEPGGTGEVYNAVSEVPRCRVIVTENTKSPTYQMRWRSVWGEVMKSIPPDAAPGHFLMVLKNFFETMQLKEEDKQDLKMLNEMMMMKARIMGMKDLTALQAGIQGDTLQSAQLQMQLDQMAQQMAQMKQQKEVQQQGGMGGMEGGGMDGGQGGAYPVQLPDDQALAAQQQQGGGGGMSGAPVDVTGMENNAPERARASDLVQAATGANQLPAVQS